VRLCSAGAAFRAAAEVDAPRPVAGTYERALEAARSALGDEVVESIREAAARLEIFEVADEGIVWATTEPPEVHRGLAREQE
jgi:hypothetical protein